MDFKKFKDRDATAEKAVFTAKIDAEIYEKYQSVKKEHRNAGCVPYLVHDIVQEMLVKLTEQMQLDIEETKK